MKMHLYEYYQIHKDSVNKYGEVLPEMKLSKEDIRKLRKYLDVKEKERLEQLKIVLQGKVQNQIPLSNMFVIKKKSNKK